MEARSPRSPVRVLSCPHCGGTVTLRAPGSSVSAVCASCFSIIDVATEPLATIAAAVGAHTPPIPIGTRATLVGAEWEVVGFQTRSDPGPGWRWDEYLLFNPYEGFRFLLHDDADWVLYAMLRQDVPDPAAGLGDGRAYRPLRSGQARTEAVMGEFYWRVRVGDTVAVQEYEAPPFLLSREANGEEVTWSRGVQLPAATVRAAFGLMPAAVPATGLDHLARRRAGTRRAWLCFALSVLALLALSSVSFDPAHNSTLLQASFEAAPADRFRPLASAAFAIPGSGGNLAIMARAPVSNDWVQLGWSLVNQDTERSLTATSTIEEYDGVDSDGAWTEGGQAATVMFPRVPGGTYRLLIDVDAKAFRPEGAIGQADGPRPVQFEVTVVRHVPSSLNFWLAVLLLLPYPLFRHLVDRASRPLP